MQLMPGTVLKELDETDIDSLFPWYLWKTSHTENKADGSVIWRDGKPYRRVMAKDAAWLKNTF